MTSNKQTIIGDLVRNGKKEGNGKVIVRSDPVSTCNDDLIMKISANLDSKAGCCCGSDNPFLMISRGRSSGTLSPSE